MRSPTVQYTYTQQEKMAYIDTFIQFEIYRVYVYTLYITHTLTVYALTVTHLLNKYFLPARLPVLFQALRIQQQTVKALLTWSLLSRSGQTQNDKQIHVRWY